MAASAKVNVRLWHNKAEGSLTLNQDDRPAQRVHILLIRGYALQLTQKDKADELQRLPLH